jgi:hypothetical protein
MTDNFSRKMCVFCDLNVTLSVKSLKLMILNSIEIASVFLRGVWCNGFGFNMNLPLLGWGS